MQRIIAEADGVMHILNIGQEGPVFVIVHGLGAPKNVGMARQFIESALGYEPTYVMAQIDRYSVEGTILRPFDRQSDIVFQAIKLANTIIEGAGSQDRPIIVVSHSMGAFPAVQGAQKYLRHLKFSTSMGGSRVSVICMAPPGGNAGKDFLERRKADGKLFYYSKGLKLPGINRSGITQMKRSSESDTFIPPEWFAQLEASNLIVDVRSLCKVGKMAIICASHDPILGQTWKDFAGEDLLPESLIAVVDSHSHDFADNQSGVAETLALILKKL